MSASTGDDTLMRRSRTRGALANVNHQNIAVIYTLEQ